MAQGWRRMVGVWAWWWVCMYGNTLAEDLNPTNETNPTLINAQNNTSTTEPSRNSSTLDSDTNTSVGHTTYYVTGREYQDKLPHNFKNYKIKSYRLHNSKTGPAQLLECCRKCDGHDDCSSFSLHPGSAYCHLLHLNHCSKPAILVSKNGHHFYERANEVTITPPTCYSTCLNNTGDCNTCGRPSCWGTDCLSCATMCWMVPNTPNGNTILWSSNRTSIKKALCSDGWQLWWKASITSPANTPREALKLRVTLVYEDLRRISANFNSVSVINGKLSVGNYTGGEAQNWWQAPFVNRSLVFDPMSNCQPFYSPFSTCVSNLTKSVAEQLVVYNGSVNEYGFVWSIGDDAYDTVNISVIKLWVTCANCSEVPEIN